MRKEWGNITDKEKNIISWALVKSLNKLKYELRDEFPRWKIKKAKKEHVDLMEKLECREIISKNIGQKGFYIQAKSGIKTWINIESTRKKERSELIEHFVKAWCCNKEKS